MKITKKILLEAAKKSNEEQARIVADSEVIKKFRDEFSYVGWIPEHRRAIETFILKALKDQRESILKKIEGMKESGEEKDKSPYDQPQPRAYNKALTDAINLIKSDI